MRTSSDISKWHNADLVRHAYATHPENYFVKAAATELSRCMATNDEVWAADAREHLLTLFGRFGW